MGEDGRGEGGIIGIESVVVKDAAGNVIETRSEILQDHNCGGMFRAWVDEKGTVFVRVWREEDEIADAYFGERITESVSAWAGEKAAFGILRAVAGYDTGARGHKPDSLEDC